MQPLIPSIVIALLIYRAYTRQQLTIPGILAATVTATIHALHPCPLPFALLCTFFLLGTTATKVKKDIKASLTLSASSGTAGEGPRTHVQVLANSACASACVLAHIWQEQRQGSVGPLGPKRQVKDVPGPLSSITPSAILLVGVIANYAAVTADTLSSELGILSSAPPRLITTFQPVPKGTNGGVTLAGLAAGSAGAFVIGVVSAGMTWAFCLPGATAPDTVDLAWFVLAVTLVGTLGTLLDSLLGAILQASVVDSRTGKVVEGVGGARVLVHGGSSSSGGRGGGPPEKDKTAVRARKGSRAIATGRDILDNNQINLAMAACTTLTAMAAACAVWSVPPSSLLYPAR